MYQYHLQSFAISFHQLQWGFQWTSAFSALVRQLTAAMATSGTPSLSPRSPSRNLFEVKRLFSASSDERFNLVVVVVVGLYIGGTWLLLKAV